MEKFSRFRDPLTGINPFIPPRRRAITLGCVFRAFTMLPLYLLYLAGLPVLPWLLRMRRKGANPSGTAHVNSTTEFDRDVVQGLFRNVRFVFPEGTTTNNMGVLAYDTAPRCDYVIGLRYTPECVFMPEVEGGIVSRVCWVIRLLGHGGDVEANCVEGQGLAQAAGLPSLSLDKRSKAEFLALFRGSVKSSFSE